jgi:hypothetical protein
VVNGVIINPPHDFKQPSCLYCRGYEITKYESEVSTYGITCVPNVIQVLPGIMSLLNAHNPTSQLKSNFGSVRLGYEHAQRIVVNGVIIMVLQGFKQLSHFHYTA